MPQSKTDTEFTTGDFAAAQLITVPIGAVVGGVQGIVGKACYSFFNSSVGSAVGGFAMFAGVGAVAYALEFIPILIVKCLIDENSFLEQHPCFQALLRDTASVILDVASIAAAASILSLPIVPTIMCMMVLPVVWTALKQLVNAISFLISLDDEEESQVCYSA